MNVEKYTIPEKQNLKAIVVFDPRTHTRNSALLDADRQVVIGLNPERPYHPALGAIKIIEAGGFVPGSELYGFECFHVHDDLYRLGALEEA